MGMWVGVVVRVGVQGVGEWWWGGGGQLDAGLRGGKLGALHF